jgi:hypothetical protein
MVKINAFSFKESIILPFSPLIHPTMIQLASGFGDVLLRLFVPSENRQNTQGMLTGCPGTVKITMHIRGPPKSNSKIQFGWQ